MPLGWRRRAFYHSKSPWRFSTFRETLSQFPKICYRNVPLLRKTGSCRNELFLENFLPTPRVQQSSHTTRKAPD